MELPEYQQIWIQQVVYISVVIKIQECQLINLFLNLAWACFENYKLLNTSGILCHEYMKCISCGCKMYTVKISVLD